MLHFVTRQAAADGEQPSSPQRLSEGNLGNGFCLRTVYTRDNIDSYFA